MTQITRAQEQQLRAAAEQVTARFQAFQRELTADEQAMFNLALWQVVAEAASGDESVVGFANRNPGAAATIGISIIAMAIWEGLKAVGSRLDYSSGGSIGPEAGTRPGSHL